MTPEQAVFQVIESVTPNVFPTQPEANTPLPFIVYTVTGAEPVRNLGGPATLTKYTVQIESWADTSADANALLAGVRAVLDHYQGGQIHRAFWEGQDTQQADDGYHGTATYSVWLSSANVVPAVGPNAVIRTDQDGITLEACSHTLTLDCDGLALDGAAVDLSAYARKDQANTFTAVPQTFRNGANNVAQITGTGLQLHDNGSTRSGVLSYNDPAGAYRFGRSDHANVANFIVNSGDASLTTAGGTFTVGTSSGQVTILGRGDGGHSVVDMNRRNDDNAGVGGSVRCWTRTGQTQPALEVLAPGGATSTASITPTGQVYCTEGVYARPTSGGGYSRVFFNDIASNQGWRNESAGGSAYYGVVGNSSGSVVFQCGGHIVRATLSPNGQVTINPDGNNAAGVTHLAVKGSASQTANLQQWQNSGGTVLASVSASGGLAYTSVRSATLTPSAINSLTVNDYAPGLARFYRLSANLATTLTGLSVGQVDGQEIELWNVGTFDIALAHQDVGSTAANRFFNPKAAVLVIPAHDWAILRYDATSGYWRTKKL